MFRGPLVPTAVTRAKQGRAEIDDTGLIQSFIGDVIFRGIGICFGCAAFLHFRWDFNTFLVHCSITDDLYPSHQHLKVNPRCDIRDISIGLFLS